MVVLPPGLIIAIVVIVVVIVLVLVILLVKNRMFSIIFQYFFINIQTCWLCYKCEQCARWSRRTAVTRAEVAHERVLTESRREFDEIRQQHDTVRDQIRVKYNLTGGNSDAAVIPQFFLFDSIICIDDLEPDNDDGSIEFCFFIYIKFCEHYQSIFDGRLFHLRAECLSSLTPLVIFKIDIDEMCLVRFVSREKCLCSILLMRVELKYIFFCSPSLSTSAFHFFFFSMRVQLSYSRQWSIL